MIRLEHPYINFVYRLFSTREEASKKRRENEYPVTVHGGWVLVHELDTNIVHDEYGLIRDPQIISEIKEAYETQK
jgi:hypothetical protein